MSSSAYLKYMTPAGNCYLYCPVTGQIVSVSTDVYEVIDVFFDSHQEDSRFGALSTESFDLKSAADMSSVRVDSAVKSIRLMREEGFFPIDAHKEQPGAVTPYLYVKGQKMSFNQFIENYCRVLVLELTQQCNFRCTYCIYNGNYSTRRHCPKRIQPQTAEMAGYNNS